MPIQFRTRDGEPTAIGRELLSWWSGLDEDRGGRAILRRASSPTQIALTAPYQRVFHRLRTVADIGSHEYERLAAIVGLLAHVKDNETCSIPEAMSQRDEGGDRPHVSELRFLRLLDAPDVEALYIGLRRVLPLMKHKANVLALADDFNQFFRPDGAVKKQWAYNYRWLEKTSS